MSRIHVCLVSAQPIPNLTTVFQFKPDKCVLLYTTDVIAQKDRLERVIKGKRMKVDSREIKPYDIGNVIEVCEKLVKECGNCEISLNITGGTKIGTLGTFQVFYTHGKPIYYVDTHDNEIIQVSPSETRQPIDVKIPIKDYLSAYGFNVKSFAEYDKLIYSRKEATEAFRGLAIKYPWAIGKLNSQFPKKLNQVNYPFEIEIDKQLTTVAALIGQAGLAKAKSSNIWAVSDEDSAAYLHGFWFEEYVYMTAKSIGADEVKLNVEGKWDAGSKTPTKNEFDVLVAKGNRLHYISCKTANVDRKPDGEREAVGKEYLYELDSLSDKALGLFGKRMLASARPIADTYVKERAKVLGIKVIDGRNIATLKENLKLWLSK